MGTRHPGRTALAVGAAGAPAAMPTISTTHHHGRGPLHRLRVLGAATATVLAVAGTGLAALGSATPALAKPPLPFVATGGYHSCALMPDQTVWCWGQNIVGQLGDGTHTDSTLPVKVSGLAPAIDIAAGEYHSCAVTTTNEVWCWGSNAYGELGNGTTTQDSATPVHAAGFSALQVSAGHEFTCAVSVFHFVRCWGDNNYGELGDGTMADSSTPVVVKNLSNVIAVSAGYYHACAIESNGTLWCWGDNGNGELGNGSAALSSDVPVIVPMQNVTAVSAGNSDTCAIGDAPGHLLCWGWNIDGELGNGSFTDSNMPVPVGGTSSPLTGVQQFSVGNDSTCAIVTVTSGPVVLCWGDNNHGKLGDGSNAPDRPFPGPVFGLAGAASGAPTGPAQVAVGGQHACVVVQTAQVECWGYGFYGQLGDGSSMDRHIPAPVIGLPGPPFTADAVTAGTQTSCAISADLHTAECWGLYVGNGSSASSVHTKAVPVSNVPAGVSQVSAGWGGCALVHGSGLSTQVRCWGFNKSGQLGDGFIGGGSTKAVLVKNLSSNVTWISNGGADNCALVHNGGAWCWGADQYGQLGDGTSTDSGVPVAVQGLPLNLAQIAAGFEHTCALLYAGTVRCWGNNNDGQLGDGSTSDSKTAVDVSGLGGVVQIAVADSATCALRSAGDVWCWGADDVGELGDGKSGTSNDSDVPVQVTGLPSSAVAIAAADSTICAVLVGGQVDCWGDNTAGQLGTGSVGTPANSDVPVASTFTSDGSIGVSAGFGGTICGLDTSQVARCWGYGGNGELGDGATSDSGTPVVVKGIP